MDAQAIDYDALAKQAGAISSQPPLAASTQAAPSVDYDALAKQAGAISSQPAQPTQSATSGFNTSSLGPDFKPDYSVDVYAKPLPPDAEPGFWSNLWGHIKDNAMAPFDLGLQGASGVYRGAAGTNHLLGNAMDVLDQVERLAANLSGTKRADWYKKAADWFHSQGAGAQQTSDKLAGGKQDLQNQLIRSLAAGATQIPALALSTVAAGPMAAVTGSGELGAAMGGFGGLSALEQADKGVVPALTAGAEGAISGGAYHFLSPLGLPLRVPLNALVGYLSSDGDATAKLSSGAAQGLFSMLPGAGGAGVKDIAGNLMPEGALVKSRLNEAKQNAIDFLAGQDVHLDTGTRTGNRFVKAAQMLAGSHPLGVSPAMESAAATEQGLSRVAGELANEVHPDAVTPETSAEAVKTRLNEKIAVLNAHEQQSYGNAWEGTKDPQYAETVPVRSDQKPMLDATGKSTGTMQNVPVMDTVQMPVDVRDIKTQIAPIVADMEGFTLSKADRNASVGYQAAKTILNGPDYIPARSAELGLGALKTMARVDNPDLRNITQGIAAGIIPQLQEGIDAAVAKTGPEKLTALQEARATHAMKMDVADVADAVRNEPVETYRKLTRADDAGIAYAREVESHAPGVLRQVGRAYIADLFSQAREEGGFTSTKTLLNKWNDLGPETKKLFFPDPKVRASLDNFFLGQKMVSENPNPSGTAAVASIIPGGLLMIHNPVSGGAWLLGGYAASKLLFSPRGARLLTEGLKPESPAKAAWRAGQIMNATGGAGVRATPPEEPPEGPPAGGGSSPPPNLPLSPAGSASAPSEATLLEGASNASDYDTGGPQNRQGAEVPPSSGTGASQSSRATSIPVPGSARSYEAHYAVKELGDIQPSHNGLSFAPNEKYGLVNDRDYRRGENQFKILHGATGQNFDPRYLITDNPDAGNGPPVVDSQGNVLGGNGRGMILQRVYAMNSPGAQAYKKLLAQKAGNFGLDADQVRAMKQPVLVREIPDAELTSGQAKQGAVTDFNVKGTAELRPSEKALADSRRVSQQTLDDIGARLDAKGPDGTLKEALEGTGGADVLRSLITDGAIPPQEAAAYVSDGKLTPAGKTRISQAILGRFFHDPAQMDRIAPSVRNKLERIAAPLARVETEKGWSLTPHVQAALDLLEDAAAHGDRNLDDYVGQAGLFAGQSYLQESVTLAKAMRSMTPTELTRAARSYAQDGRFAAEGTGLFGEPPTPAEAFASAFGKAREVGPHGPVYREFYHDAQGALKHFQTQENGDAIGALHHSEVGDIDLTAAIAKKLREKHPEVLGDLQGFISGLRKSEETPNRIHLTSPDQRRLAVVRLDYDGAAKRWLVTAFEKKPPGAGRTTDIPGAR